MEEKALAQQQMDSRALALEECQRRILDALKKGLLAYKILSRELVKIQEEELYTLQFERYDEYCRKVFKLETRDIERIHKIAHTVFLLEQRGLLLPENENQILELARLQPERRAPVWQHMLEEHERKDIELTSDFIRLAVKKETQSAKTRERPKGIDAQIDLGVSPGKNDDKPKKAAPVDRISLTARGERALTRLRTLCGDSIADALENRSISLPERDIVRWGEEADTDLVRNLVYYISHRRWSLDKSLAYESKLVDGNTKVDDLITLARARNGRVATKHLDARIIVEIFAT